MYVDDIILIGNDLDEMERLKGVMAREFEIKDLRPLRYFFGMEVIRSRKGIVVSQRKMLSCKPFDTPMDQNKKIGAYKNGAPVDKGRYINGLWVGLFIYHTRLDIVFAMSLMSKYMHGPCEEHLEAVS